MRVRGTVQGVGLRPTVWRLARDCGLTGTVCNDAAGVLITLSGAPEAIAQFQTRLPQEAPPLAQIVSIETHRLPEPLAFADFQITASLDGNSQTQVSPDAAICPACCQEILTVGVRRYRYPFTNCTHCGPRLSIVTGVPYDRPRTTMATFPLCNDCARDYGDPSDRRFHAQPIACPTCGPQIWLDCREELSGVRPPSDLGDQIDQTVALIRQGSIVAIKGLGGFHLACDATNAATVQRLRQRKHRYGKPFALMARNVNIIRRYCTLSTLEQQVLVSPAAPIVLLEAQGPEQLPQEIAPGSMLLGFMLPYTPLHLLLLQALDFPIVMTSGNLSQEPQVTRNAEAQTKLAPIADAVLYHNRDIANRIDDSVVRVMAAQPRLLRRARGYAPNAIPLPLGFESTPDVLAYGGELKSTFCLIKDGAAILSQHQGDLEDLATVEDYQTNLQLYRALYDHQPQLLVCDRHPNYLSTQLAQDHAAAADLPLITVQHHHAHIASCLAEHGVPLTTDPVLGIALDGLGLGADGTLWGGEFLWADYSHAQRLATFKPVAMIGGVQAIREPWRNTYAHLTAALGWSAFANDFQTLDLYAYLAQKPHLTLARMLVQGINAPLASSCGRLFDAVSAAVGLCRERAWFEGQAAIALEMAVDLSLLQDPTQAYPFAIDSTPDLLYIEPSPMWHALLRDLQAQVPIPAISTRFHQGLTQAIIALVQHLAGSSKCPRLETVVLSGGCFQNKVLLEAVTQGMDALGLTCLSPMQVPANDGGLALGQGAIAAAQFLRVVH